MRLTVAVCLCRESVPSPLLSVCHCSWPKWTPPYGISARRTATGGRIYVPGKCEKTELSLFFFLLRLLLRLCFVFVIDVLSRCVICPSNPKHVLDVIALCEREKSLSSLTAAASFSDVWRTGRRPWESPIHTTVGIFMILDYAQSR